MNPRQFFPTCSWVDRPRVYESPCRMAFHFPAARKLLLSASDLVDLGIGDPGPASAAFRIHFTRDDGHLLVPGSGHLTLGSAPLDLALRPLPVTKRTSETSASAHTHCPPRPHRTRVPRRSS